VERSWCLVAWAVLATCRPFALVTPPGSKEQSIHLLCGDVEEQLMIIISCCCFPDAEEEEEEEESGEAKKAALLEESTAPIAMAACV